MTAREVYWIWLYQALDAGCKGISKILECYPSAFEFYKAGRAEWQKLGAFSQKQLAALVETPLQQAEEIYADAMSVYGYSVLTPEHFLYPKGFFQLPDPPAALYCKGSFPDFEKHVAVAVVGTRSASPYGLKVAYDISGDLSRAGVIVVSGGALGVDITAHRAALDVDGVTVAVLGCGLNYPYLMENAGDRAAIAVKGALISEYPPSAPPLPRHFPVRNRMLSALTQGTLVVEAAQRSGALITARYALEQGKDVFAIPGNIGARTSRGSNELIQSGAKAVLSAEDILVEYRDVYPGRISSIPAVRCDPPRRESRQRQSLAFAEETHAYAGRRKQVTEKPAVDFSALSEDARTFYKTLSSTPRHLDELTEQAGLTPRRALCAVTELELLGVLQSKSGKRYYIDS